mgnify:CR=1 FL=1
MSESVVFASQNIMVVQHEDGTQKIELPEFCLAVVLTNHAQVVFQEEISSERINTYSFKIIPILQNDGPRKTISAYLSSLKIVSPDIRYFEYVTPLSSLIQTKIHIFGVFQSELEKELPNEYLLTDISGVSQIVSSGKVIDSVALTALQRVMSNIYQKRF